jgi:hypothetical protein
MPRKSVSKCFKMKCWPRSFKTQKPERWPYTESLTKPTLSNLPLDALLSRLRLGFCSAACQAGHAKIRVWRCPPLRTGQPASTLSAPTQPGIFQAALSSSACPLY